jgi:hypothetical protein
MRSIFFIVVIIFLFFNCAGKGTPGYESLKLTIEEQEKMAPLTFLSVDGKLWENLIGQTVIEGDISSSATVAKFKDVVLKVNFYTKTGTFLGSEDFVVYEFVNPGQSVHFKIKSFGPEASEKIDVKISEAVSVD